MKYSFLNQISSFKGIYGFFVVNKQVSQKIDTIWPLLLDDANQPITWEAPTQKSDRIISQSRFEVMDKLDLFEKNHKIFFHVACKHLEIFDMIFILGRIAINYRVTQYQYHGFSCS